MDFSTDYELRNVYLYFDVCTLDAAVQSQYAELLRSGQALNMVYQSALMQTQTILNEKFYPTGAEEFSPCQMPVYNL